MNVSLRPTLDVKAVADYLNVSTITVKRRIKDGKLRAYKDGGYWKIKREWLLEYEERLITGDVQPVQEVQPNANQDLAAQL